MMACVDIQFRWKVKRGSGLSTSLDEIEKDMFKKWRCVARVVINKVVQRNFLLWMI